MSVQEVFNKISLTKDEAIWESDEDTPAWNRKRIQFLSTYSECMFENLLAKEKSAGRKNMKLSAVLFQKAQKAQETSSKLRLLNEALMFSPPGQVMDEIFRSRANIFYNIDRIVECHTDIQQINQKNADDKALLKYQANSKSEEPNKEPSLEKKNTKFTNLSCKLDVKSARNKGRFVTATQDILPGELIAVEKSLVGVLDKKYLRDHCETCMKSLEDFCLPCLNCSAVAFCSKACRDLNEHHYVECLLTDNLNRADVGAWWLALRLMASKPLHFWLKQEFKPQDNNKDKVYCSSDIKSAYTLVTHDDTADRCAPVLMKECLTALFFLRCLQKSEFFPHKKSKKMEVNKDDLKLCMIILHFMRAAYFNSHEVTEYLEHEDTVKKIGVCLNPSLALINHSCDSNYSRVVRGRQSLAFATRFIKAGEQVFDAYSPTFFMSPRSSRLEITERYNFNCGCDACVENWPTEGAMSDAFERSEECCLDDTELTILKEQINKALEEENKNYKEEKNRITDLLVRCHKNIAHPNKFVLKLEMKLSTILWKLYSTE